MEAMPERRTGSPYSFSVCKEDAGFALWRRARPEESTLASAVLWEEILLRMWGWFPFITPTCSEESTDSIKLEMDIGEVRVK